MPVPYFIDFRLRGYAKEYANWAISRVHREAKRLGVKKLKGRRPVPHISLFGPAKTNSLRGVIAEVESIGRKHTFVPFKIDGFSRFDEPNKVIYLDEVVPEIWTGC